jgi:hypothetical protein
LTFGFVASRGQASLKDLGIFSGDFDLAVCLLI